MKITQLKTFFAGGESSSRVAARVDAQVAKQPYQPDSRSTWIWWDGSVVDW